MFRMAIVPDQRHFPRLSTPNHRISTGGFRLSSMRTTHQVTAWPDMRNPARFDQVHPWLNHQVICNRAAAVATTNPATARASGNWAYARSIGWHCQVAITPPRGECLVYSPM